LFAVFIGILGQTVAIGQQHKPVTITRVYTGPDNQSHAEQVIINVTPVASPQSAWSASAERMKAKTLVFRRLSPGFVNDWHPAANPHG
jgi:N-formylglutamate amidohydrolase